MKIIKKVITPPDVIIYWVALAIWGIVYLGILLLLFLTRYWHLAENLPVYVIIKAFWVALKFDLVVVAYIIVPFMIISVIPYIGFKYSHMVRKIIQFLIYFLFSFVFLLILIDIEYFAFFGDHLGVWFYIYLDDLEMV